MTNYPRDGKVKDVSVNGMNPAEWEEIQLKSAINKLKPMPPWQRLFEIRPLFMNIHYINGVYYHFENTIAPFFFANFPEGKIWFVERSEDDFSSFIKKELDFAHRFYSTEQVMMGFAPQSYSGLNFYDIAYDIGLSLPLSVNFPELYGINVPLWGGSLVFIPASSFDAYKEYRYNIIDALTSNLDYLYADYDTVHTGLRPKIRYFDNDKLTRYLEWYISKLDELAVFLLKISDPEKGFLYSLSLSRICVETYQIQCSISAFSRKVSFFNLLDKYANLLQDGSTLNETQIWKDMLSKAFFKNALKPLLEKIDATVGSMFGVVGNMCYEDVAGTLSLGQTTPLTDSEVCEILRAYRNSHHGYLLTPNPRRALLNHTGNISNVLPDISTLLWHSMLENPTNFFNLF